MHPAMPTRRSLAPLVLVLALVLAAALTTSATAGPRRPLARAAATCPFTFQVLHDDRIGRLQLPMGFYRITTTGGLSCEDASDLFRQFLEDYDGVLSKPWSYVVLGSGHGTFRKGSGGPTFTVTFTGTSGGGGDGHHPNTGLACPSYFTVLHNDRIGSLRIPHGRYRITLLSRGRLSCPQASSLLAQFLQDFDGKLPGGWLVIPAEGAFVRGSLNYGFRIKLWVGSGGGLGASTFPTNEARCGGTFRVLHNDRIGKLRFPAGPYYLNVIGSLSCRTAASRFRQFLNLPSGRLPSPWVLNVATGTFRRGRSGTTGFRAKPAFRVR